MNQSALLVDTANIYHTVGKKFNKRKLDYRKLKEQFGASLLYAFGTRIGSEAKGFIDSLKQIGYYTKFVYIVPGRSTSLNIDLAITAMTIKSKLSEIILVSSDRDLTSLVHHLRDSGIRVFVVGCGINKDLKLASDGSLEISEDLLEDETNIQTTKE